MLRLCHHAALGFNLNQALLTPFLMFDLVHAELLSWRSAAHAKLMHSSTCS
jgi:hypothetical protein